MTESVHAGMHFFPHIPEATRVALLLRHSNRDPLAVAGPAPSVGLTALGRLRARRLGQAVGSCIGRLFSSPSVRCIETARAIAEGAGMQTRTRIRAILGEPGAFVLNIPLSRCWYLLPATQMVNLQLAEVPMKGVRPIREGVRQLLQFVLDEHHCVGETKFSMNIFVTHDSVLAPFIFYLLEKRKVTAGLWPEMLEGVGLWLEGESVVLAWRGGVYDISDRVKGIAQSLATSGMSKLER